MQKISQNLTKFRHTMLHCLVLRNKGFEAIFSCTKKHKKQTVTLINKYFLYKLLLYRRVKKHIRKIKKTQILFRGYKICFGRNEDGKGTK